MPKVVNSQARIVCPHGGQVLLIPKQTTVLAGGAPVMCAPDLVGAPIAGCTVPVTPATKPCTTVVSTLPGSTAVKVSVTGRPVYVDTLVGTTDGVPPAVVTVASPGQTVVDAT